MFFGKLTAMAKRPAYGDLSDSAVFEIEFPGSDECMVSEVGFDGANILDKLINFPTFSFDALKTCDESVWLINRMWVLLGTLLLV